MAEMTIRLRCDPETGKRDIIVQLHSDADALPHEHEQLHRQLVDNQAESRNPNTWSGRWIHRVYISKPDPRLFVGI